MGSFDFDRYFKRKYKTITPEQLTEEQIGEPVEDVVNREKYLDLKIADLFKIIIDRFI